MVRRQTIPAAFPSTKSIPRSHSIPIPIPILGIFGNRKIFFPRRALGARSSHLLPYPPGRKMRILVEAPPDLMRHLAAILAPPLRTLLVAATISLPVQRPVQFTTLRCVHQHQRGAFHEMAGSAVAVDELVSAVSFENAPGRAGQGAVGGVGDGAHPGRGGAGLGWEEGDGDFVLAGGLVYGEAEVGGEGVFDCGCEGLGYVGEGS